MSHRHFGRLFALLSLACLCSVARLHAAGVTLITHGLNGNADTWVTAMAAEVLDYPTFPGTTATFYKLYFVPDGSGDYTLAWQRIAGSAPFDTDSGEIFVMFDWRQLANDDYSTYEIARVAAYGLLQPGFISEMNGRALAELPLHLIGHSRGGSLVSQLSYILGTNGVWVDHLTTLDPHPLNNDIFDDEPFYFTVDAPVRTYENVLFHDNYFQWLNVFAYGEPVAGAFTRELVNLSGGYEGVTASHSDAHLWYHGTIDTSSSANDWEVPITVNERFAWWVAAESYGQTAGYFYSRVGRGDRLSRAQPGGPGTTAVRDGFNQRWDFGAGQYNNRVPLGVNNGAWPSLIKANVTGPLEFAQGTTNSVALSYQWAVPMAMNATVSIYLDIDFNPYSENEELVFRATTQATGPTAVRHATAPLNVATTNSTPGFHSVLVAISGGGRTRFMYAPEIVRVLPPAPPTITTHPVNKTVTLQTPVTFAMTATGAGPLSYQWYHDGAVIENATTATLQLTAPSTNNLGGYFVVVSNAGGSVTSSVATLQFAYAPVVHVPATTQTLLIGDTLTIPATVEGTGPFTYRWFWNNRPLPIQASATLTLGNVQLKQRGTYSVEVRNSVGVQRASVTVQVYIPPTIISQPRSVTVANGKRVVLRSSAKGSKPISYQWLKDNVEIVGATAKTLIIPSVQAANAGSYTVRVSNPGATRISNPALVTVLP